jgi:hypothetical protein
MATTETTKQPKTIEQIKADLKGAGESLFPSVQRKALEDFMDHMDARMRKVEEEVGFLSRASALGDGR